MLLILTAMQDTKTEIWDLDHENEFEYKEYLYSGEVIVLEDGTKAIPILWELQEQAKTIEPFLFMRLMAFNNDIQDIFDEMVRTEKILRNFHDDYYSSEETKSKLKEVYKDYKSILERIKIIYTDIETVAFKNKW